MDVCSCRFGFRQRAIADACAGPRRGVARRRSGAARTAHRGCQHRRRVCGCERGWSCRQQQPVCCSTDATSRVASAKRIATPLLFVVVGVVVVVILVFFWLFVFGVL